MTAMLIDSFGRRIEYLRVSVTDRCNYRCFYCMPAAGAPRGTHDEFLRHEELARLVRLFAALGVHKVRLTGGEPLVIARKPERHRFLEHEATGLRIGELGG